MRDELPAADEPVPDLLFLDAQLIHTLPPEGWPGAEVVIIGAPLEDDTVVELLRRTAEHLIADRHANEAELVATSVKVLTRDLFGVEKYLAWGAHVIERDVSGYDQKREAVDQVGAFARAAGARRTLVTRIECAVDELLMNALYDAPALGRTGRPAQLRYGADGRVLAVSVEDVYGSLGRDDIVDHVTRARREKGRPRELSEAPGAGLGLYFIVAHANRIVANVQAGRRTEMICLFDLYASGREIQGARSLHFFAA